MGEVKRYVPDFTLLHGSFMKEAPPGRFDVYRKEADYARLERERDVFLADKTRLEHQHNEAARQLSYQADELTRLRAVEEVARRAIRSYTNFDHVAILKELAEACGRKG